MTPHEDLIRVIFAWFDAKTEIIDVDHQGNLLIEGPIDVFDLALRVLTAIPEPEPLPAPLPDPSLRRSLAGVAPEDLLSVLRDHPRVG